MNDIRNIAILAHVDAGKTTLTEQMLLHAGVIRAAGRVDAGTAHTDALPIERQRGISVRAAAACLAWRGVSVRIIDTPGHADFAGEVEDALAASDGAVLVVSAVEGVQAQTAAIARALDALNIPTVVFLNKTDRAGADAERVMDDLCALLPRPIRADSDADTLTDALSAVDDELLEQALNGTPSADDLRAALARACSRRAAVPVVMGAALRGIGVSEALDAVLDFLPPPAEHPALSVAAYHLAYAGDERRVSVRVYGGSLAIGDVHGAGRVKRLRKLSPGGARDVKALLPGDVGVAVGLAGVRAGDWLGERTRGRAVIAPPILRAGLSFEERDTAAVQSALMRMQDEQPHLDVAFEPSTRRFHLSVMGEIHAQVIEQELRDGYGLSAALGEPSVLYRETPKSIGEGRYDMKGVSPWYSMATFRVEPGEPGSGVAYISEVSTDFLYLKYQRDIEYAVRGALSEGLCGWPVTDIIVRLTDAHMITITKPGSKFGPVVPLGLFEALSRAGTALLEPVVAFEAACDEKRSSKVLYDLSLMGAKTDMPVYAGGAFSVRGVVSAAASIHYAGVMRELSGGRGVWRTAFHGWERCAAGAGHSRMRTTPDPLNRALFMDYIVGRVRDGEGC